MTRLSLKDIYATDTNLQEDGAWITLAPGAEFKVARSNSKRSEDALKKARAPYLTVIESCNRRKVDIPRDVQDKINLEWVVNGLLVDWRGDLMRDADTGEEIRFSPETARELLADESMAELMLDILKASMDVSNYRSPEMKQRIQGGDLGDNV